MHNELIKIGNLTVYGYGLMIAIGIILAYFISEYRIRKNKLDDSKVFGLVIWSLLSGFCGAKLLYWITILPIILQRPAVLLETLGDGWVIYGGIIGGILGAFIYLKKEKQPFLKFFDVVLAQVALAQALGRIGCFLAGCCYGLPTQGKFAITFTSSAFAPNNIPLIPTQLISSGLDFLLFILLLVFYGRKGRRTGQCTAIYLICYSLGRFVLEFFRGDLERGAVGVLSTSQFISVFVFAAGILLFIAVSHRRKAPIEAEACIFDLDGTLLYTLDSIAHPTNEALKQFGLEPRPLKEYKMFVGDGYRNAVARALIADGDSKLLHFDEVYAYGKELYDNDPLYKVEPYEGMKEQLQALKEKGIKLAVLTNKPHPSAIKVVESFFGKDTFDVILGQIEGEAIKPDRAVSDRLLKELATDRKKCLYFGDSDTDMITGNNAKFFTVGVLWGYRDEAELIHNGCDGLVKTPGEISKYIN